MRTAAEVWQSLKTMFTSFSWTYAVEWILLFLLVYFVMKTLYNNNARKLIFAYLAVLIVCGAVSVFTDHINAGYFYIVVVLLCSLFFLLLFSVEIKRSIWNVKKTALVSAERHAPKTQIGIHAEECITAIVKAVQTFSKNDIGALIVFSNGNLPKEIVESGVTLNSSISSQLIEGIFIPKAPLHDGAMIIAGNRIKSVGCILPVSHDMNIPKSLGLRHRAALGMSQQTDALCIIVSEETGNISVAQMGKIKVKITAPELEHILSAEL